ncbi:hypothetical protein CDN99_09655 [Roseateles aquatilis]|uniref:Transporter n=1 Tax=Roseateles aquatilis TaxID=431061 RepID=A0A246JFS4_9BURK|nr:TolC family protein [Roseateles aquatilis]OWQ91413.1 hypothetical protein CDN99_09655 [Roseateles aquatilis]
MKKWKFVPVALFGVIAAACAAQTVPVTPSADLPSDEVGIRLIQDDPSVAQARFALEAARQRAQGLNVGPNEWAARSTIQRRRDRSVNASSNEWTVGIERAIRINGKAGIDRDLGEAHIRLATSQFGEARHEAAAELMTLWLDWTAAQRLQALWQEQVQSAQENFKTVDKRRTAGDASTLELNSARADLAEVQRQLSLASNEEARARAKAATRFPTLRLEPTPAGVPSSMGGDPLQWRERILSESEELRSAREATRLAELVASRARADRIPDPTVGVFTSSERAGAERIVGLTFGMPIGGSYRQAQERESLQQAEASRAAADLVQRQLEARVAQEMANVEGSLERWRLSNQSLDVARDNARLTQRAYAAGEADLQTLLLARRQGIDAALGAEQARTDALRSRYRLLIDAHLIWGLGAN